MRHPGSVGAALKNGPQCNDLSHESLSLKLSTAPAAASNMIRPAIAFLAVVFATASAAAETGRRAMLQQVVDVIGSPPPTDRSASSPQPGNYGGTAAGQPQPQPGWQPAPPAPAPAAPGIQPPAPLSTCNAGACWDSQGNRYNATGDGSRFLDSNGRLCIASGRFITCN